MTPQYKKKFKDAGFRPVKLSGLKRAQFRAHGVFGYSVGELAVMTSVTVGIGYVVGSWWKKKRATAAPAKVNGYLLGADILGAF